ncbi:MAG: tRNA (adenosine(37)-N6)-dimethylallyltransferase MiaA [Candidatus Algichlamydia australiensis]|nr:tRNA (adenosine(37)-N6)-dimethylallyltransferase MiaA [Chlamydiales bacterium]
MSQDFGTSPLISPKRSHIQPSPKKGKVLVLAGPTATGKTKIGIEVAKKLSGEIISADSMQVYLGMDIGTAKASLEERLEIPHHLIDICEIADPFNVAKFHTEATRLIEGIIARDQVPIVVGGTGFYIHALLYGPPQGPPSDEKTRMELEEELGEKGVEELYERLKSLDPEYAKTITPQDRVKIVRALEIIKLSDEKVSKFKITLPSQAISPFDFHCWFLHYPREILYPRIEMRCDEMIAKGFVKEVEALLRRGLRENRSAALSIGYRQCIEFLESDRTSQEFEKFIWSFKQASRRYAKRQFTWFRKEPLFHWLDLSEQGEEAAIDLIVEEFISSI